MVRAKPHQIFVFCYHKVGTILFQRIWSAVCDRLGWSFAPVFGATNSLDTSKDVILFAHSLIGFDLRSFAHRGVRIVRDPRDVWVSGYLYHLRCSEAWCRNQDFRLAEPILFPRVPKSQEHRPEAWKHSYLAGLNGKSYQQNLLDLDRNAGLSFEMERYADWTSSAMATWQGSDCIADFRLESIVSAFDETIERIFLHLGLTRDEIRIALPLAASEDIGRMDNATLGGNPHIHSRELSKWRSFLTAEHLAAFQERHGELITRLGYNQEPK